MRRSHVAWALAGTIAAMAAFIGAARIPSRPESLFNQEHVFEFRDSEGDD